jgi:aminoglycoside phosphotransferase (APT) family kinase protein
VGFGALTEGAAGRYDSAVAELDDGRRVVVRAPADPTAATELAAEARALRALTPGVRGLLPFRAPELLGEAGLGDSRAVVVDFLPGYRVDAAHLPPGRGAATSIGEALAALHALPLSIVRTEGLPVRTPQQVRDDVSRLIDRVDATRVAPSALLRRWYRAVDTDRLWRFESAVVLGGAGAASFLFDDVDGVPRVTGVLEWHGLSVGDPATDLQWLASAPIAAEDVFDAYVAHSRRAPDGLARERARLYAELEFAKWLVHGTESGRSDIVDDAVGLLESLEVGVRGEDIVPESGIGVDDAIALLDRVPEPEPAAVDTSMHTDAYDPEELSLWVADQDADDDAEPADRESEHESDRNSLRDSVPSAVPDDSRQPRDAPVLIGPFVDNSTAPIDVVPVRSDLDETAARADAVRASDAALRRWLTD